MSGLSSAPGGREPARKKASTAGGRLGDDKGANGFRRLLVQHCREGRHAGIFQRSTQDNVLLCNIRL